jgi:hypothetical protein
LSRSSQKVLEYVFFENEVSRVKFSQINTALGLKYFQKTYKMSRKLALSKAQTSPVLL